MSGERLRILKMVEEKKISAEEATSLLEAIESPGQKFHNGRARWLKVRVFEKGSEKPTIRVTVPLSLLKIAGKLGGKFHMIMPEAAKAKLEAKGIKLDAESFEDIESLFEEFAVNGRYQMVDIEDNESGDRVEVYVE